VIDVGDSDRITDPGVGINDLFFEAWPRLLGGSGGGREDYHANKKKETPRYVSPLHSHNNLSFI